MNTNTDISKELKNYVDATDDLTARNILEMLEVQTRSLWFGNELMAEENDDIYSVANEKSQLSFEQVKELYPDWFNE